MNRHGYLKFTGKHRASAAIMPRRERPFTLHAIAGALIVLAGCSRENAPVASNTPAPQTVPASPAPVPMGYHGCPPEGDGGDRSFNRLKNRVDSTTFVPTPFAELLALGWPRAIEGRWRSEWGLLNRRRVGADEGRPVAVEGFFSWARLAAPEGVNCHRQSAGARDWHIWLVGTRAGARSRSIVVEATPPVRERHPRWNIETIREVGRQGKRVRVSGWLLMDAEHPDQLNRTRGSLWEIHPVIGIEIDDNGSWVALDDYTLSTRSSNSTKKRR
ncbi:MAG TPA: hypothetical protein VIF83_04410 [Gemmatimonadaceae bacterium]|jgi:hypothetical protein